MAPATDDSGRASAASTSRRATRARPQRITDAERDLLAFASVHRLIRLDHVERFLGLSRGRARTHLRALTEAGALSQDIAVPGPLPCWQITGAGLRLIGSGLRPPPTSGRHAFVHEVGVAWLWLAARDGRLGAMREIISERELRSRDRAGARAESPLAVRLGGSGTHGLERLHYPDLLLMTATGHRVAVELELTSKSRPRRQGILAGYGADPAIDVVLYLVDKPAVGTRIIESARRLGISSRVIVQEVDMTSVWEDRADAPAIERARKPARGRAPGRSHGRAGSPAPHRSRGPARPTELER